MNKKEIVEKLRSASMELSNLIGTENERRKPSILSADLDEPEYLDYQTCDDLVNIAETIMSTEEEIEFDTSDIVLIKGYDEYMDVVGVIHDDKRLFVSSPLRQEFEVTFDDVEEQFKRVENADV